MAVAFDPFAIAADLAQCVCTALKAESRGEDVWTGECCVRPGSQVAWDSCCEGGGQAWVVMLTGFPTTRFPLQDGATADPNCGVISFGLNFEVGVLRCASGSTECDTMEAEAAKAFGDLQALLIGLNCCFGAADEDGDRGWRLNSVAMVGPEGGCVGSKITITVNTEYPCCPITEET